MLISPDHSFAGSGAGVAASVGTGVASGAVVAVVAVGSFEASGVALLVHAAIDHANIMMTKRLETVLIDFFIAFIPLLEYLCIHF
jgi:hypothetical protein